jgi:hypothetical protein
MKSDNDYRFWRPRTISKPTPTRAEAAEIELGSISGASGGGGVFLAKAEIATVASNKDNRANFFTFILQTLFYLVFVR